MNEPGGRVNFVSSRVARRIALIVLFGGLVLIAWWVLGKSPVESRVELSLEGSWPSMEAVTLVYTDPGDGTPRRQTRFFPQDDTRKLEDRPVLTAGSYDLDITVTTEAGVRRFENSLDHERSATHQIVLRY